MTDTAEVRERVTLILDGFINEMRVSGCLTERLLDEAAFAKAQRLLVNLVELQGVRAELSEVVTWGALLDALTRRPLGPR